MGFFSRKDSEPARQLRQDVKRGNAEDREMGAAIERAKLDGADLRRVYDAHRSHDAHRTPEKPTGRVSGPHCDSANDYRRGRRW